MQAKQEPVVEIQVDTYEAPNLQPKKPKSSLVVDMTLTGGYHSH